MYKNIHICKGGMYIYIHIYKSVYAMPASNQTDPHVKQEPVTEGSLEVKLPTIWRDGKAEVGRVREEKIRDGEDQRGRKSEERRCFTPYHPAPGASSRRLCQGCATRAFDDLVLFDGSHRNTLEVQVKSVKS